MTVTLTQIRRVLQDAAHDCTEAATGSNEASKSLILSRTATTLYTVCDRLMQAAIVDGQRHDTDLTLDLIASRMIEHDRRGRPVDAIDAALEALSYLRTKRREGVAA